MNEEDNIQDYDPSCFNFSLKQDCDFFNDELYVPNKLIGVKYVGNKNVDKWTFTEDNKPTFSLDGSKFSEEQRKFFKTVEGMQFLILQYKLGLKNQLDLKEKL